MTTPPGTNTMSTPTAASDDTLLRRPILVLGSPRSGTTMLAQILRHHAAIGYVGEPRLTWRYGNDTRSDMLRPEDARSDVTRHIRRTFAQQVRAQGKTRLLEKSPDNSLRMGFVEQVLPDAVFVHTVRNGVDAVLSIRSYWQKSGGSLSGINWRKRLREVRPSQAPYYAKEILRRAVAKVRPTRSTWVWGPNLPGIHEMRRELDLLDICCLQWRTCVEAACHYGRQLPSNRYMEMRLENFDADQLRTVMRFCGLEDDAQVWAEFDRKFRPSDARSGARSNKATQEEIRRIMSWIEPTMHWLGYPTS